MIGRCVLYSGWARVPTARSGTRQYDNPTPHSSLFQNEQQIIYSGWGSISSARIMYLLRTQLTHSGVLIRMKKCILEHLPYEGASEIRFWLWSHLDEVKRSVSVLRWAGAADVARPNTIASDASVPRYRGLLQQASTPGLRGSLM